MPVWELNQDLKIRLNLSALALSVIEQDRLTFRAKSRTSFLNQVFLNAYLHSGASIAQALARKEQEYTNILESPLVGSSYRDATVKLLLNHEREALVKRQSAYEKAHEPFLHTLSDAVAETLNSDSVRQESKYYSIAQYFRGVIEDYCRMPMIEREAVYFREHFDRIQQAIASAVQLEITSFSNTRYLVHPYQVLKDPVCTAHYLACYGRTSQQTIRQKMPQSFRIANIKQIRLTNVPAFISKADRESLDLQIREQGVQFLAGQTKEIQVRLTPQGIRKLNRHSTLRPVCVAQTSDGVFTFRCTETQAEYYFLKLGADAEILMPARLRRKFKRMHEQAAANYNTEKD